MIKFEIQETKKGFFVPKIVYGKMSIMINLSRFEKDYILWAMSQNHNLDLCVEERLYKDNYYQVVCLKDLSNGLLVDLQCGYNKQSIIEIINEEAFNDLD